YKRIFDMKDTNDSRTIINNGIYVEGDNKGKIKQNISNDNLNKKWYQKWWLYSAVSGLITTLGIWWSFGSLYYAIGGGIVSAFIIWKLNPKFRFRNIGYSLLLSGTLSNIIPFSGIITIPKNDLIHGVINLGENQYSLLLILLAIPFFILDLYENKR
ncbi:MAG: hypothetical protein LGB00_02120, partial [Sulfurovum sp.]|nr:hypothetical protein [Sulfurovum sp.]